MKAKPLRKGWRSRISPTVLRLIDAARRDDPRFYSRPFFYAGRKGRKP